MTLQDTDILVTLSGVIILGAMVCGLVIHTIRGWRDRARKDTMRFRLYELQNESYGFVPDHIRFVDMCQSLDTDWLAHLINEFRAIIHYDGRFPQPPIDSVVKEWVKCMRRIYTPSDLRVWFIENISGHLICNEHDKDKRADFDYIKHDMMIDFIDHLGWVKFFDDIYGRWLDKKGIDRELQAVDCI